MARTLKRHYQAVRGYLVQHLRIRHDPEMGNRFEIVILSLVGSALLQINSGFLELIPAPILNSLLVPVGLFAFIFLFFREARNNRLMNFFFGPGGKIWFDKEDKRCFERRVDKKGYANYHVAVHARPGKEDCLDARFELVDLRRVEKGVLREHAIARPLRLKWFEHDAIGYEPATLSEETRAVIAHLEADGRCLYFDIKPGTWPPHQEGLLRNIPHGVYKLTVRIAGNYAITQTFRLHWFGSPADFALDIWKSSYAIERSTAE